MNNLGYTWLTAGKYEQADKAFRESQAVFQSLGAPARFEYAKAKINLANLRQEQARLAEAVQLLEEAVTTWPFVAGTSHPDYAVCLNNLALVRIDEGKLDEAAAMLTEATEIQRRVLGRRHPSYLLILDNGARLERALGDRNMAGRLLEQAAQVALELYGEQHPEYARHLLLAGQFACDAQQYGKAEAALRCGARFWRSRSEEASGVCPGCRATWSCLWGLAECRPRRGLGEGRAWRSWQKRWERNIRSTLTPCVRAGEFYRLVQRYRDGEAVLQEAARIAATQFGRCHPEYARALTQLGELYNAEGNPQAAEQVLRESAGILTQALGSRHPEYAQTLQQLAAAYRLLQQPDLASKIEGEAQAILAHTTEQLQQAAVARLNSELERHVR